MERGDGGAIVNVSSQASQCALKQHAVYCKPSVYMHVYACIMYKDYVVNVEGCNNGVCIYGGCWP